MKDIYWALVVVLIIAIMLYVFKIYGKKSEKLEDKEVSHYTLYFTTWCPACKNMRPVWDEVTSEVAQECADNASQSKCPEFKEKDETDDPTEGIKTIPTIIRHYTDGSKDQYPGGMNRDRLKAFLQGIPIPSNQ